MITSSFLFWILMLLWLFFGVGRWWRPAQPGLPGYFPLGSDLIFFVLLVLLGWHDFGPPFRFN